AVQLRGARRLHRVPPDAGPARPARPAGTAVLAGLADAAGRGARLRRGAAELARRITPLHRGRGVMRMDGAGWVIDAERLCRDFVVRHRAGHLRRERRVVHAVDSVSIKVTEGESV